MPELRVQKENAVMRVNDLPSIIDIDTLDNLLNGKTSKVIANNTRLTKPVDGSYVVTLHSTDIITYRPDIKAIYVNTGGWNTTTTRSRIQAMLSPDVIRFVSMAGEVCTIETWDGNQFTGDQAVIDSQYWRR